MSSWGALLSDGVLYKMEVSPWLLIFRHFSFALPHFVLTLSVTGCVMHLDPKDR